LGPCASITPRSFAAMSLRHSSQLTGTSTPSLRIIGEVIASGW
jgi:hypothetical protein